MLLHSIELLRDQRQEVDSGREKSREYHVSITELSRVAGAALQLSVKLNTSS